MYSISCFVFVIKSLLFDVRNLKALSVSAKIFQYYGAHEQEECIVFERKICCLKIQTTFSRTLDVT